MTSKVKEIKGWEKRHKKFILVRPKTTRPSLVLKEKSLEIFTAQAFN